MFHESYWLVWVDWKTIERDALLIPAYYSTSYTTLLPILELS